MAPVNFRRTKSEVPFRMVKATKSRPFGPIRFSRRLRNLSPEPWDFLNDNKKRLNRKQSCATIKKELSVAPEKKLQIKNILEIINKGSARDLEQFSSVGSKTANKIVSFRNLKGPITRISDLANMPNFPKRRYENFLTQNCLKLTN